MNTPKIYLGILSIGALFLLFSLVLLVLSQIPFEWIKPKLDALATDGDAEIFTWSVFVTITQRLQIASVGLACLAGLIFWQKHYLNKFIYRSLAKRYCEIQKIINDLKQYLFSINHQEDRIHLYMVSVLIFMGIGIRLFFLYQPIRHDEAFTFTNYASKPLLLALSNYSFPNNHLFHTLCVHISYLFFGNHVWAIRLPAFLASSILLPVTYLLARELYNKHTALLTTGLMAISSALIEYATNARGYALIALFFFFTIAIANYLRKKHNTVAWIILSGLSAIGFYTVPVMLYPFGTIMLWISLMAWKNDFSLNFINTIRHLFVYGLLTLLLTGLLYFPVILASGVDAIIANRFVQPLSIMAFLDRLPLRLSEVWTQWSRDFPNIISLILCIATIISVVFHQRIATHGISLAIPAVLFLVIALPTQGVLPPARVWLYLLPLFFLLSASGITHLLQKLYTHQKCTRAVVVSALGLCICGTVGATHTLNQYYPYGPGTLKDAEQITQYLDTQFKPNDRLITIATAAPLEYYFQKHNVSISYLRTDMQRSTRLIVLVLENKYTLDQVLQTAQVTQQHFSAPKLLRAYPSARLYEMNRLTTVAEPKAFK